MFGGITIIRTRLEEQQELERLNDQLRAYVHFNRVLQAKYDRSQVVYFHFFH